MATNRYVDIVENYANNYSEALANFTDALVSDDVMEVANAIAAIGDGEHDSRTFDHAVGMAFMYSQRLLGWVSSCLSEAGVEGWDEMEDSVRDRVSGLPNIRGSIPKSVGEEEKADDTPDTIINVNGRSIGMSFYGLTEFGLSENETTEARLEASAALVLYLAEKDFV